MKYENEVYFIPTFSSIQSHRKTFNQKYMHSDSYSEGFVSNFV
jgi:hypothetical protein